MKKLHQRLRHENTRGVLKPEDLHLGLARQCLHVPQRRSLCRGTVIGVTCFWFVERGLSSELSRVYVGGLYEHISLNVIQLTRWAGYRGGSLRNARLWIHNCLPGTTPVRNLFLSSDNLVVQKERQYYSLCMQSSRVYDEQRVGRTSTQQSQCDLFISLRDYWQTPRCREELPTAVGVILELPIPKNVRWKTKPLIIHISLALPMKYEIEMSIPHWLGRLTWHHKSKKRRVYKLRSDRNNYASQYFTMY